MNDIILRCAAVEWEDVVLEPDRLVLVGGICEDGILRHIRIDAEGRVVWAPEVDELRRDLAEARQVAMRYRQTLARVARDHCLPGIMSAHPTEAEWLFEEAG